MGLCTAPQARCSHRKQMATASTRRTSHAGAGYGTLVLIAPPRRQLTSINASSRLLTQRGFTQDVLQFLRKPFLECLTIPVERWIRTCHITSHLLGLHEVLRMRD